MFLCPWNFPGKNTGVGCYFFLWGIPDTGTEATSPVSPVLAGRFFITEPCGKFPFLALAKSKMKEPEGNQKEGVFSDGGKTLGSIQPVGISLVQRSSKGETWMLRASA